jgi:6-phosphogluconolactonase (cycloisomerase 2 family)
VRLKYHRYPGLVKAMKERHLHYNDTLQYVKERELSGEVLVYDICHEGDVPAFTLKQQIQADEVNAGGSADIRIHPSGRWLYTSHRLKNDGIAAFHIFPDGTLKKMDYTITGRHPRNFMITDDGEYLLVACRDDKCVQVFQILPTGRLAQTSTTLRFDDDKPVCVTVIPDTALPEQK